MLRTYQQLPGLQMKFSDGQFEFSRVFNFTISREH